MAMAVAGSLARSGSPVFLVLMIVRVPGRFLTLPLPVLMSISVLGFSLDFFGLRDYWEGWWRLITGSVPQLLQDV